ncbi:MAG: hypothetical protein M1823_003785 [Watsoniomyces obsoletus]|nr:MAG: hypothetical protein M1823_003785 [Watsoniomyces obsoletus]
MAFGLLLLSLLFVVSQRPCSFASARTPGPWQMFFNNSKSVGPDGPWRVVTIGVGFPDQWCDLYPGGQGATLLVSREVCQQQNLTCPFPPPQSYNPDKVRKAGLKDGSQSDEITPRQWDPERAQALNLTGSARYHSERLFIRDARESHYVESAHVLVSSSFALQYPGGTLAPLSVGLLGMGAPTDTMEAPIQNGSTLDRPTLLAGLAAQDVIGSRSWGLHIGSVKYNISGSLVFGGYDQSRILGEVATFDNETTRIVNITTNIFDGVIGGGGSAGLDRTRNGMRLNHTSRPMEALLDASVPYMYLPPAVCESMARALDLELDANLQLYLWKRVDSPSSIVNTSSHVSFQFSDARNKQVTVRVPLALLNLTLESPLVTQPTPYFPCRPTPAGDSQPYRLGRAFLQAAFVARNWESGKLFVAQAPGPNHRDLDIKRISGSDTALVASPNPPTWNSTWEGVLELLTSSTESEPASRNPVTGSRNPDTDTRQKDSAAAAVRAKDIRIGVGVAVPLAILLSVAGVIVFLYRRRRRLRQQQPEQPREIINPCADLGGCHEVPGDGKYSYPPPPGEMPGQDMAYEVDSQESCPKATIGRESV